MNKQIAEKIVAGIEVMEESIYKEIDSNVEKSANAIAKTNDRVNKLKKVVDTKADAKEVEEAFSDVYEKLEEKTKTGDLTVFGGGGGSDKTIQGIPVSTDTPTNGDILQYNNGEYELIELDSATGVGTRTYTEQNYVTNGETVTESIDSLDIQLKDTEDKVDYGPVVEMSNVSHSQADNSEEQEATTAPTLQVPSEAVSYIKAVSKFDNIDLNSPDIGGGGELTFGVSGVESVGMYMIANFDNYQKAFFSLRKNGNPTDNLVVEVVSYTGGPTGVVLYTTPVGVVTGTLSMVSFDISGFSFNQGEEYFLQVTRTGAIDGSNNYVVDRTTSRNTTQPYYYYYTGSEYIGVNTVDLIFRVEYRTDTQNASIKVHGKTLEVTERVYDLELDRSLDGTVSGGVSIVGDSIQLDGTGSLEPNTQLTESFSLTFIGVFADLGEQYISDNASNASNRTIILFDVASRFRLFAFGTELLERFPSGQLVAGERFCITFAVESGDSALYFNGLEVASSAITYSYLPETISFFRRYVSGSRLEGSVESLLLHSKRLTQSEANVLHQGGYITDGLVLSYTGKNFSGTEATPTSIHNILPIEGLYDGQVIDDFTQDGINYTVSGVVPTAYKTGVIYTPVYLIFSESDITTLTLKKDANGLYYVEDNLGGIHNISFGASHWSEDVGTITATLYEMDGSTVLATDTDYQENDVLTFTATDKGILSFSYTLNNNTYRTSSDQISALPASHSFEYGALKLNQGLIQKVTEVADDVEESKTTLDNLQSYHDKQGWVSFTDTTSRVISSGVRTQLTLTESSSISVYAPKDTAVSDFVSDDKILARNLGGTMTVRVDITASFAQANSGFVLDLDIGGTQGIIYTNRVQNKLSGGTVEEDSFSIPLFTLGTFIANGAEIYITPSSNMTITNISLFIQDIYIPG